MNELMWSKTPPDKEGWYWVKSKYNPPLARQVLNHEGLLCVKVQGLIVEVKKYGKALWAGPIQGPPDLPT